LLAQEVGQFLGGAQHLIGSAGEQGIIAGRGRFGLERGLALRRQAHRDEDGGQRRPTTPEPHGW